MQVCALGSGLTLLVPFVSRSLLLEPSRPYFQCFLRPVLRDILQHLLCLLQQAAQSHAGSLACKAAVGLEADRGNDETNKCAWELSPEKGVGDLVPTQNYSQLSPNFTSLVFSFLIWKMTGLGLKSSKPLSSYMALGEIQQAQACQCTPPVFMSSFREGRGARGLSPWMEHGALSLEN